MPRAVYGERFDMMAEERDPPEWPKHYPTSLQMWIVVAYVAIFTVTTGLLGFTTGLTGIGLVCGVILGGWYGCLRTKRAIGLGPLWLLLVMALGGFLGPAVDADRHLGAIIFGIIYGWVGFISDKLTRILFAVVPGFIAGGIVGGSAAGAVVGAIAAGLLVHRLRRS